METGLKCISELFRSSQRDNFEKAPLSKMGAASFKVHYLISSDIWKIFTPFCSFSSLLFVRLTYSFLVFYVRK